MGADARAEQAFVLDLDSNPHPRMLAAAIRLRRRAQLGGVVGDLAKVEWSGYLSALVDATGCFEDDLLAWLDRHEGEVE